MIKWISICSDPERNNSGSDLYEMPYERWGHASVVVDQIFYIIGGFDGILLILLGEYRGDFWAFSFKTLKFTQLNVTNGDSNMTQYIRSNHSACYYPKTKSIYLFGGSVGHVQYNDLIIFNTQDNTLIWQELHQEVVPQERTYHAEEIIDDFVFIIGGEGSSGDIQDLWAFDINEEIWILPQIQGRLPKRRFLTCTGIGKKLYLFGGCIKEYKYFE